MKKHSTNEVLMIRPCAFQFNDQTAVNNAYQQNDDKSEDSIQELALKEFDQLVKMLEEKGVKVNVLNDSADIKTPDSIFPNNWFSTHEGGNLVIYPMFAENRRAEIKKFREDVVEVSKCSFKDEPYFNIYDYSNNYEREKILEGTGSMVIDRKNGVAYCALSPRADKDLFLKFCNDLELEGVYFNASQDGVPIYHTNVLMGIGQKNAIICLESIEESKRDIVKKKLMDGGNDIIEISLDQVKNYLGNTLELVGSDGKSFIAMSTTAYNALTDEQRKKIEQSTEILHANIPTIEFYGGGSVRCMLAEIF